MLWVDFVKFWTLDTVWTREEWIKFKRLGLGLAHLLLADNNAK